jgi:pyrimidine operon attenuation protein/uracil phosphoribosyltransferase
MEVMLTSEQLAATEKELAGQMAAAYPELNDVIFVGIQQGGVIVGNDIIEEIKKLNPGKTVNYGQLDITFYRDDIRKEILAPDKMNLPFDIENKRIILIDDVLFTGRTIKAALDALLDYGRPAKVELCVLIDRKEHRQFPIRARTPGSARPTDTARRPGSRTCCPDRDRTRAVHPFRNGTTPRAVAAAEPLRVKQ